MSRWIGVDVGGTFTDLVTIDPDGGLRRAKRPSSPDDPGRAVHAGVQDLDPGGDAHVAHGTTVATNALLERRGGRTVLLTTEGFADLLHLGRGDRPHLYELCPTPDQPLVPRNRCVEVAERMGPGGVVIRPLEESELQRAVHRVAQLKPEAVAVALLFSYAAPEHERRLGVSLRNADPECFVCLSSEVLPRMREVERASTTVVNAYLGPVVAGYLRRLEERLAPRRLWVMGSHGGILHPAVAARLPVTTLLSGPAAGVSAAWAVAQRAGCTRALSFDMGGTSTDVALCAGEVPLRQSSIIDGQAVHRAMVDVHTVGAGGGSLISLDPAGELRVGPRSAGARPGPAAYGRGGRRPTITDAHVQLGRLPSPVPLGSDLRLDAAAAERALAPLAEAMGITPDQVALAAVAVAEARMERALRAVSVERGEPLDGVALVAHGGAGPLHAAALAEALGLERVVVPASPGTLSALGLLVTPPASTASRTVLGAAHEGTAYPGVWRALEEEVRAAVSMATDGVTCRLRRHAALRYRGQGHTLRVPWEGDVDPARRAFHRRHEQRFGYRLDGVPVELVSLEARAEAPPAGELPDRGPAITAPTIHRWPVRLADGEEVEASVYAAASVPRDRPLGGPLLVLHGDATTWLPPGWRASRLPSGDILARRQVEAHGS